MGMTCLDPAMCEAFFEFASIYGQSRRFTPVDTGAAMLAAALALLSQNMNSEQVRDLLEQAFEWSAPIRRATEERWKATGFDPYANETPENQS
jgi:hypothetical protein